MLNEPKTLTPVQQKELFKVGDKVTIRSDGHIYTCEFVGGMSYDLGKEGIIRKVYQYLPSSIYYGYYEPGDYAVIVVTKNSGPFGWQWHYKSIIPEKGIEPSYKPKRIERTLESVDYDLTPEEQQERFKVGDRVKIKKDGDKYTKGFVEPEMNYELGKEGRITNITRYGANSYDTYKPTDMCISVEVDGVDGVDGVDEDSTNWNWHYKSLIPEEPNYSPKKIIRESLGEFRFTCIAANSTDEIIDIQNELFKLNYQWLSSGKKIHSLDKDFCIFCVEYNSKILGRMDDINEFNSWIVDLKINPKLFNYDELHDFLHYIQTGFIRPSYKPKKIIRESLNTYDYKAVVIHARTNEEVIRLQLLLFSLDFHWSRGKTILNKRDNEIVIFATFQFHDLSYLDTLDSYKGRKNHWVNEFHTDGNVYTLDDWITKLRYILKREIPSPSYKPKKIVRESIESNPFDKLKYNCLIFKVSDNDDLNHINDFIKKNKFEQVGIIDIKKNNIYAIFIKDVIYSYTTYHKMKLHSCNYDSLLKHELYNSIIAPPLFNSFYEFEDFLNRNVFLDISTMYKPKKIIKESNEE